jgi:cysteine desulfurase
VIYLDHHATTPLDPRVLAEMWPYFEGGFGNPHSRDHAIGWRAGEAVEKARQDLAEAVGAGASEIIFTSGATEANNMALRGVTDDVLVSSIEHPSVLKARDVTILAVDGDGLIDPDRLAVAIEPSTRLVSIALVNHEIGIIQPIAAIAEICHARDVLLHVDCAQALGKVAVDVKALGIDLASFSAHKAHGPMGVGALFIRTGIELEPLMRGGSQEMGLRAGTVPLPLVVGFATAAAIAREDLESERERLTGLRDGLLAQLRAGIPGLVINGSMTARIAGNLNLTLPKVDAEDFILAMPDIAISAGSACASGSNAPSPVLAALGLDPDAAARSIRLCLGRFTTAEDVGTAAEAMIAAWRHQTTA